MVSPPWVRPRSDVEGTLAEHDPWWQLSHKPTQAQKRNKREQTLELPGAKREFVEQISVNPILSNWIGSLTQYSVLKGLHPDLYRAFMARTWTSALTTGVVGLVHPISHFTELRANGLRRATYSRLRRHWHFTNSLGLYEIDSRINYGVHIYGTAQAAPRFVMASSLYHPDTVTGSLNHDGTGDVPGLRDDEHQWDTRPHKQRIQHIDTEVLETWKSVLEDAQTPALETRMLFLPNTVNATVLGKIAQKPRIRELGWQSSSGWHESGARRKGYFEVGSARPSSWAGVIIQGPHFNVATPLSKEPRPAMRSSADYDEIDLESIPVDFIPVTNYQPNLDNKYAKDYTKS